MKVPFTAAATVTRISSTADGGLSIGLRTQELSAAEKTLCMDYHNSFGHFLFKENEFQESDIPKQDIGDAKKTPSQRLRSIMYKLYKQSGTNVDFEVYYRLEMDKINEHFKKKIDGI